MRKREKENNECVIGHGGKNVLEEFQKKRNVVCQNGFYVFHITENERNERRLQVRSGDRICLIV